jgi:aminoglycoside phosphotransferase (APT) family kinase protein
MVAIRDLKKVAEGREAEMFAWEDGTILRLFRDPARDASLHWEAQALEAARSAGVRAPAVIGTVEVDGRTGLVMERIEGVDLLTLVGRRPWNVWRVGALCGRVHSSMHDVAAPPDLPSLRERIEGRLRRVDRVPEAVAAWTREQLAHLPDGDRLCHGDIHPGNIMMQGGDPVVIDWTGVARGDPAGDYARTALILGVGLPSPGTPFLARFGARFARPLLFAGYEREYCRMRSVDPHLLRRWLPVRAADRLADGIEHERPLLLRIIADAMRST